MKIKLTENDGDWSVDFNYTNGYGDNQHSLAVLVKGNTKSEAIQKALKDIADAKSTLEGLGAKVAAL